MDAFDSDVLIFIAGADDRGARALAALVDGTPNVGSVVLLPELLSKPVRMGATGEKGDLQSLLARIELKEVDRETADAATSFAAKYRLRAADAIHLATAVVWGAERFHTNNSKDFGPHITEIEIVHPA